MLNNKQTIIRSEYLIIKSTIVEEFKQQNKRLLEIIIWNRLLQYYYY